MRAVTKSNPEWDFFSFLSKQRKYADVLLILAQNKSILHMHVHNSPYLYFGRKKSNRSCSMKELCQSFQAQYRLRHRGSSNVTL